jgi:hypothetical protein
LSSSNQFTSVENLPLILAYFNKIRLPFSPGKNDDAQPWSAVSILSGMQSATEAERQEKKEMKEK